MKKIILTTVAIFALILGVQTQSFANTIWQIGLEDTSHLEYPANAVFYTPEFNYFVDLAPDPINNPNVPSYLSDVNLNDIDPFRRANDTTPKLRIHYNLPTAYENLVLHYGRWGSESDQINSIFSSTLATTFHIEDIVPGTAESVYGNYVIPLSSKQSGNHILEFQYLGGGANNGHYYDYIRLVGTPVPEPSSMLLLGSGLVFGLVKRRKRKAS